jgi:hypothetical protein
MSSGASAVAQLFLSVLVPIKNTDNFKNDIVGGYESTIDYDTEIFVKANFANTYGYYYDGASSSPPNALPDKPNKAMDDILVWDPQKYAGTANLNSYLQNIFTNLFLNRIPLS